MNGITEIRMRKIQSRTRQYRRRYEWREISCLTVCSLFLLAGIGILLGHIQEPGISSVAEGYGAVLLRNGADLYVTIGIASFTAGVVMTIICIRFLRACRYNWEHNLVHVQLSLIRGHFRRNEYEKAIEQNAQYPADMQHGDDADAHNRFCDEP